MRVLITGGAGFLGSHLCESLIARGDSVVCVDNLSTGRRENIAALEAHEAFEFIEQDVTRELRVELRVDAVAHLASPASPPDYHRLPLETLAVGSRGTENALMLATEQRARFVLASTSEIYGDPLEHPQHESYYGNVNSIGPRSVYDEAKRYAEAVTAAYRRSRGTNTGIVRIFNTYGPRMRASDGRVVSSFITQALTGSPITLYGDGMQTRSFCYVSDLVRGLVAMLDSNESGPVNLGNPNERTVAELATIVARICGTTATTEFQPLPKDDPTRRKPDITRAQERLGWAPVVDIDSGLGETVAWFRARPDELVQAEDAVAGAQFEGRLDELPVDTQLSHAF